MAAWLPWLAPPKCLYLVWTVELCFWRIQSCIKNDWTCGSLQLYVDVPGMDYIWDEMSGLWCWMSQVPVTVYYMIDRWTFVAQEQFSGGNFHTNKDAGGMWCREHSHRGLSIVSSQSWYFTALVTLWLSNFVYASLEHVCLNYFLYFVVCGFSIFYSC